MSSIRKMPFDGIKVIFSDIKAKKQRVSSGASKYMISVAVVSLIDYEEHVVTLRTISGEDQEFQRVPIPMTYPGAGSRHFLGAMPEAGDQCIVGWMNQESDGRTATPVIIGWVIPGVMVGHDWLTTQPFSPEEYSMDPKERFFVKGTYNRIRHKLRHMGPGNIVASSSQGADLVLNEDVQLSNRRGNEIILRDNDQAVVTRACQQFTSLSGTRTYSGMVQRDAAILPSKTISDNIDWDCGQQLSSGGDIYTDYDLSGKGSPRDSGKYIPHPVFDRIDADGTYLDGPASGLSISPSIDPYEFLKKSLSLTSMGTIKDDLVIPSAVYGGKYINRVSSANDVNGRPLNAAVGSGGQIQAYTEHRIEITHTSDGQLPVTEQTDGFDAERLPTSTPTTTDNRSSKFPFIEYVMGTVVGNDPFSVSGRRQYGLPLRPVIFDGGLASPVIESAVGYPIDDQAATLFKMTPPIIGGGPDTFWSVTKGGKFMGSIGGKKSDDYSAEIALLSGLKISSGGKITLETEKGLELKIGGGDSSNMGLNMGSDTGAVRVYGGGRSTSGAAAARSCPVGDGEGDQPNLILEGKDNISMKSSRKVMLNTGSLESRTANVLMTTQSGFKIQAGDSCNIVSKTFEQVCTGKASYAYHGPKDNLPTNGAFRETVIAGLAIGTADKYTLVQGDREELLMLGNHKTSIIVGDISFQTVAGKFSVTAGTNTMEVDMTSGMSASMLIGDTSFTNVAGSFSVDALVAVNIKSTGTSTVSGVGGVSLGGPGKIGGIVCGSDLDPLTGMLLSALGMGSPGHSLTLPV